MEGELHVYTHSARPRRFLSKLSGKWVRVNAVLKGGQLELTAVSGGEVYTKSISLDETTACAVQKCYGRANCIVITGFNRSSATKRVFDCLTPEARKKWHAAFVAASTEAARKRAEGKRQAMLRADAVRAARTQKLRQKTRTLESFMLWYEEFQPTPMHKVASLPKRRWWAAMSRVARVVFEDREEKYGYTSLELIKLQKKLTEIDARTMSEIKNKARRIIKEFVRANPGDDTSENWNSVVSTMLTREGLTGTQKGRSDTTTERQKGFMESSYRKDLQGLLRRERVLPKLTRTLELIRRKERHSFVIADAMRGLWVARCVRALLNLPGGLAAVLAMPQERGSLRRLLAAALLCRVPLLTTLVLEMLAALALLPGREGHAVTLNVLTQIDKSAKWGQPLCSDYLMRASPEALKWSSAAPRNPPPLAALATLLQDTPEHNCCPELRSTVVTLFEALCRSEPTRSAAQWTQAKIFHACRAALSTSLVGKNQDGMRLAGAYSAQMDSNLPEGTPSEASLRVMRRRSSISSERGTAEEVEEADETASGTKSTELHPCPPLRALLHPPTAKGEEEDVCKRIFRIQLEHFLDGWDMRELDEADECDRLPIGSAERTELLCQRVCRSALLVGRYASIDEALHAFGIDLEHAAFMPIAKLAPRTIIHDDQDPYSETRKLSVDMNATINSICKLHRSSVYPGPGVHQLINLLHRDGALVVNNDAPLLKGLPFPQPGTPSLKLNSPAGAAAQKRQQKPIVNRGPRLKDDPKFSKYFKLIKMHVPKLAVEAKMAQDGLDPAVLDLDPNAPAPAEELECDETASTHSEVTLENDPVYSKYFKMLKLHIPRGNVEHKMRAEGLDTSVLDMDPSEPVPPSAKQRSGLEETNGALTTPEEKAKDLDDPSKPPPLGCKRVPRYRLRRVFWDVVTNAGEGTMWQEIVAGRDRENGSDRTNEDASTADPALFLTDEGLEELEMIFGQTSRKNSVAKADACAEAAAVKKNRFENELRQTAQLSPNSASRDLSANKQGRSLVAEAIGNKRAFALNLLYGSLRISNEECVAAVASLDPDNSTFVTKLPRLGTLYNMISRKEDLQAIETKAIDTGVLDESTKTLTGGGTIEGKNLEPLSSLMVSLIDRARRPRAKVQALWLYATVRDRAAELMTSISNFEAAAQAIRQSSALKKLLVKVLSITNFVNHGSDRGNSSGVRLAALTQLQTTRTTKADATCKNLLQFIVRHSGISASDLKEDIPQSVLRAVHTGSTRSTISMSIDQLRAERDDAATERGVLSREATTQASGIDARRVALAAAAAARMATMVADVDDELTGLEKSYTAMDNAVDDALKYYGEPSVGGIDAIDWMRGLDTFIGQYDAEYTEYREQLARRERREQLARKKLARENLLHSEQAADVDPNEEPEATGGLPTNPPSSAMRCGQPSTFDSSDMRKSTKEFDRLVDAATLGAFGRAAEHEIVICAQCRSCNASTTPGAYAKDEDHSWYCADCWYEFSFHNTDWRDSFGEETVPLVSNE